MFRLAAGAALLIALAGCQAPTDGSYNVHHFTTVVIDPGHGGHDSGAISRGGSVVRTVKRVRGKRKVFTQTTPGARVLEKDLALDVALRVDRKLRAGGLRTVLTRSNDTFIPLDGRVAVSNAQRDSIFVSVHFNDSRRSDVHGMEVYENRRGTGELARCIERRIAACPHGRDRSVRYADYRVLRKSRGPAVLVECGYMSNRDEVARCATAGYREQLAAAIARAVLEQRQ